ncbi:lamin tail domain-containing protein [Nannocystis punicea]|uniref:Lamin tail domain-containing protein n=1 Tax=Nannocystis punicea TaxID=2995304 RepID=A0ABY7H0I5_9BACT|nr:lamin tail domain-containing protein [Nannocystis poenicansa]WAS92766.1 lamin tail domain-containing protein [Nannocystis poenicansa]
MSKLSYRLGFALLVLPACSNPAPADTDSDTDTSTSTSTTDGTQTSVAPTTEPPTSTTEEPTSTTTTTTESTTTEPVTSTTSTDTTDTSTTTDTTTTTTTTTDTETSSTTEAPDQCADGEKNGGETDTDCGGPTCSPCADGGACVEDTDCESGSCNDATCGLPPVGCLDGLKNDEETDIDCGGSECPACADDLACAVPEDCLSKVCTDDVCVAASCEDQVVNGEESDVDCGGDTCDKCVDGDSCNTADDCDSGVCESNVCSPASCEDTAQNGDETDVDCGGPDCDKCGAGDACVTNADCADNLCQNNVCVGPTCDDGMQNGQETDVDCGGPNCEACPGFGLVINEVDYDNLNTDNAEYIELLNTTPDSIALGGHKVVLINGSGAATYATLDLSPLGSIAGGQYLVIAKPSFTVPGGVLKVDFNGDTDKIQNGAPDGIALIGGGALIDALSYEGAMTNVNIAGVGMVSLVEGTVLPVDVADSNTIVGSLARLPNGSDTDDAATDWKFTANLTPGAANVP